VVAAAFGMDARYSPFPVNPATVLDAVSEKLRANAARVVVEARDRGTTTHVAARELAQERVLAAMRLRGRVA
jgi:glutamate dehydrogenase (NAD(P)+)